MGLKALVRASNSDPALAALRERWVGLVGVHILALVGGFVGLRAGPGPAYARRWLPLSAAVSAYQLWFVWRRLSQNHRAGEAQLLPVFGSGNALSMLRGLLLALVAGFLPAPRPEGAVAWAPAFLYTLAGVADYFDGYLARLGDHATRLGEALDIELDALGILVIVALAIHLGSLPLWFLPIGLARYAFLFGRWLRRRMGKPLADLPPSVSRRPIAGLTMGFLSAMLWPIMRQPVTTIAGVLFGLPFAAGFCRDWLVVSGVIDPSSERYLAVRRSVKKAATRWAPVALRFIAVAALAPGAVAKFADRAGQVAAYSGYGFPSPKFVVPLFGLVEAASLIALALGAAGRLAAFTLVVPLSLTTLAAGLTPAWTAGLVGTISLLILGTGAYSLWQPEDRLFSRRAGEPAA